MSGLIRLDASDFVPPFGAMEWALVAVVCNIPSDWVTFPKPHLYEQVVKKMAHAGLAQIRIKVDVEYRTGFFKTVVSRKSVECVVTGEYETALNDAIADRVRRKWGGRVSDKSLTYLEMRITNEGEDARAFTKEGIANGEWIEGRWSKTRLLIDHVFRTGFRKNRNLVPPEIMFEFDGGSSLDSIDQKASSFFEQVIELQRQMVEEQKETTRAIRERPQANEVTSEPEWINEAWCIRGLTQNQAWKILGRSGRLKPELLQTSTGPNRFIRIISERTLDLFFKSKADFEVTKASINADNCS